MYEWITRTSGRVARLGDRITQTPKRHTDDRDRRGHEPGREGRPKLRNTSNDEWKATSHNQRKRNWKERK